MLGLIDALLHSVPDWQYADRNRAFWVAFMVFFGPLVALPYLILVRPRFPSRAARDETSPFLKTSGRADLVRNTTSGSTEHDQRS